MSETIIEFGGKDMMSQVDRENLASILEEFAATIRNQKDYAQRAEVKLNSHMGAEAEGMRVIGRSVELTVHFGKVQIG